MLAKVLYCAEFQRWEGDVYHACSRPRVGKTELKRLVGKSPPGAGPDMGSIALLSPVRADGRLTNQLGAAKVPHVLAERRKEKTTPFGINLMRSLVIYQAAQIILAAPKVQS